MEQNKLILKPEVKILLVDDREENLVAIESILEQDGYIFRKARSGKDALKILLKEIDFTLILMDVEMPEIDGFETAAMIYERERLKHIPVIFITANIYSEDYLYKGYKAGAVDYLYKPINPELLKAKVGVFVELYQKKHQLIAHEQMLQEANRDLETRVRERTSELQLKNCELENTNVQLRKVNEDLDNFVYTASHDLKAPILNIEGLMMTIIEVLKDDVERNEEAAELFKMMDLSIIKFKNTIQDLTTIAKIQKNIEEEEHQIINWKDVLDDVQLSIRDLIIESETTVCYNLKDCPTISFSKKNLTSIIYNLLTNAIKYRSPQRAPLVEIRTDRDNDHYILCFKDNGLGMDLTQEKKIFSMFKRLHTHVEGSGIGLYIVKRIITNAGGKIEVNSQVGIGSEFKIYFKNNSLSKQLPALNKFW